MKSVAALVAVAVALVQPAFAHYRLTSLIAGGVTTSQYQYVRVNTNYNSPVTDVSTNDVRCNVGGVTSGASTSTYTVAAGSTVGIALDQAIFHPGPFIAYLGKVPSGSTAASWDGSGANWFKIYQVNGVYANGALTWPSDNQVQFTFKLPSTIPAGQYLLRVEHIALHSASAANGAQLYISCAQINVTGGGSANPTKVSFPGAYKATDAGLLVNIYYPVPTNYQPPGPAVFTG